MPQENTAMNQAIEGIKSQAANFANMGLVQKAEALYDCTNYLQSLLTTEREQIEKAHHDSWCRSAEDWEESASDYYTNKFTDKK